MKLSTLLLSTAVVFPTVLAVPNDISHQDQHPRDKRDVVVVTEYINQDGNVVIPPETSATQNKQSIATATLPGGASVAKDTTTLSPSAAATHTAIPSSGNADSFKDGTIKCSDFVGSISGVLDLNWIGLGGWSSIQDSQGQSATSCEDGMYCSYACDAGQVKTQWPSTQPASGASLGGLLCKDGYLYRTNKDTDQLCQSTDDNVSVVNKSSKGQIALCRTDYPGSENMNIPTVVKQNGDTKPLAVVDEDTYYKWNGKSTSAQYYVNNAGVSMEDGCIWGDESSQVGNWAPLVIGAGKSNGQTYLSLIPNPNNHHSANFNVKFKGDNLSGGECSYENGQLSSSDGCTVSVISGSVEIIFY